MKQNLHYAGEMLKAIGRIIAGLALLHYRAVFWALRLCLTACVVLAAVKLVSAFAPYRLIGLFIAAVGGIFVVWTHGLVKKYPIEQKKLLTTGPFAVVRHPMYSGCCLIAIGCAVCANYWLVTVLSVIETIFMLSFCCAEDEENGEIFASAYESYGRRVPLTGIFTGLLRLLWNRRGK